MSSMYEVLMDLPLFQGVSHTKISELIEKIRFNYPEKPGLRYST